MRGPAHIGYWIRTSEDELAGVITISGIIRGAFQSAYLGYYTFVPHNGQGRMSQGIRAMLGEVFRVHRLHRVEANIQPGNSAFAQIRSWTRIPARRLFATVLQGWWSLA